MEQKNALIDMSNDEEVGPRSTARSTQQEKYALLDAWNMSKIPKEPKQSGQALAQHK